jgi:hypothetical protein
MSNGVISNPVLVEWLAGRQKSLHLLKTTTTPSGQMIHWVPIESQIPGRKTTTQPPLPVTPWGIGTFEVTH